MAASAPQQNSVDPLDAFAARADARAYLWSIGECDLSDAVDKLQFDAERDGLVERIGQDAVQTILAAAFCSYREAANA
ncbi:MAG TPA: hypothetical protein VGH13_23070 [Xanthobacteraceae bacterium]|jgi:hypothetical protein